jgi:hypothetical protein
VLELPELGVLREGAEAAGDGDDEAVRPVEETEAQHVALEEAEQGSHEQVHPPEARALDELVVRADRGEPVQRLELVADVVVGVVPDGVPQTLDRPVDDHAVVRLLAFAAPAVLAEQSELDVGVPLAVTDPAAEEIDKPRELVARVPPLPLLELPEDLVAKRGRDLLVGVEVEDPRVRGSGTAKVALPDVAQPLVLEDPVGELAADGQRAIGAEAVHDDDLVAPRDAPEAAPDLALLVEHDDAGGDLLAHGRVVRRTPRRHQASCGGAAAPPVPPGGTGASSRSRRDLGRACLSCSSS